MQVFRSNGHVLGGALLIAGTTIGVGMLALPVATGDAGFLPALMIYFLCYLFMLCTGLLLLEVCTWMPKDSNLITMASKLLGPVGKNICWALYLFLFVTVMIAHVAGAGNTVSEMLQDKFSVSLSMIVYVIAFAPIVYLGTHVVDRLNLVLIAGVAISYILFIYFSIGHVNFELLTRANWHQAWPALPILFTAFTYQVIIPTLMTYMNRDVKKVRTSILLGTSIPLIVYVLWEFLILGIVPAEGPGGLIAASYKGQTAVTPLKAIINKPTLTIIGRAFAFLAMTTSYIGLALAFMDFLADGLKIKKNHVGKFFLCIAIFLPPLLISLIHPDLFLVALSYAGGFSCAILFGLYPPLMAWVGRYIKKHPGHSYQLPGGKLMLGALIVFVVAEVILEIYKIIG